MISHVLNDGTKVESIKGKMISPEECPDFYQTLEKIYRRATDGRKEDPENPDRVA